jgi:hypothetical protein
LKIQPNEDRFRRFHEEGIQQPARAGPETPGAVRVAPKMGKR